MNCPNQTKTRIARGLEPVRLAALILFSIVGPALADPSIRCGSPTKSGGFVTIVITLKKGDDIHDVVLRDISFGQGYPASDKADFIAQLILLNDPNETYISATHAEGSDEVQLHGQHGWEIRGHCVGQDGTGEPDWLAFDGSCAGAEALCSLSGTATGVSPLGGPGMVGIQAFGGQARVATSQGMPAQLVEAQLMQQLQSQGIPVRWAQSSDFQGAFAAMQHDDSVLFLDPPDPGAPGALFEGVEESGLQLDLLAMGDPPDPTSGVVATAGGPYLHLEVAPSVFSNEPVTIRYGSDSGFAPVRITAHDMLGRNLATLFEGSGVSAGTFHWDGRDQNRRLLPAGVYFLRLETGTGTAVCRVTRVR